jgi:hypothetical protein
MDDPFGWFPNPTLNPGAPAGTPGQVGGKNVSVFNSGSVGGWGGAAAGFCFGGGGGGVNTVAIGGISQPIGGIRLTVTSTGAVVQTVTLSILQSGPR